jgi:TRAP-type C4-dicarboxylate transport system substrate-binding protein
MNSIAFAGALAVSATAINAQELKFANFTSPAHTVNASVIEKLNADLSAATGGAVTVRGYHGGELGAGPVEQYVRAVQGAADITWGLQGYTSSQFQKTMIMELPGAVPTGMSGADAYCKVFDEISGEFPGTVPVALWSSEPNIMIMREKVIRKPEDLAGLKIRVAGATAGKVVEALGAVPVQMPINQVYQSLETGLIDGVFTGSSTLDDFKLDEVANAFTIGAPLGSLGFFAAMNTGTFDALPDEAKAKLSGDYRCEVSNNAESAWNATGVAGTERARGDAKNTFVDLTAEEIAAFDALTAPVTQAYVDEVGGQSVFDALNN